MKIPIRKLLKKDMIWLAENKCVAHDHTFLSHYTCFIREKPDTAPMCENIGIFDIETTGLKANWSHMLSWCMKEHGKDIIHEDLITSREARDKNDKRIVKSAVEEIKKYDRIVGYYSTRFDVPYVRSRAINQGIEFPSYKDLYHTDLYYVARSKFALHSNRLASICQFFGIEAKSHPMTPELWQRSGAGEQDALDTIMLHNREDVVSTDAVFDLLLDHMLVNKRSI
jgi:uncharacterized protein YprB with RNaseH-like and TPR domain